jgi:hypothetical protein
LRLDFVDGAAVAPGTVVGIDAVRVGQAPAAATQATRQMFPLAHFQELTDSQKLTQKTFESLPAGVSITPTGQANPFGTVTPFDFEPVNLAPDDVVTTPPPDSGFPGDLFWHSRRGRAASSELRADDRRMRGVTPLNLEVGAPAVAVVGTRDLSDAAVLSDVEARSATLAGQRAQVGQLVIEAHERGV